MLNTPHFLNTSLSSNKSKNILIFHGSCHKETSTIFSRYIKPIEYYGHPESLLKSFCYSSIEKMIGSKRPQYYIYIYIYMNYRDMDKIKKMNRQPYLKYFSLSPNLNVSIFHLREYRNYHIQQQQQMIYNQQQLCGKNDLPTLVISYKCNQATIPNGVKEIENAQRLFSKYFYFYLLIIYV